MVKLEDGNNLKIRRLDKMRIEYNLAFWQCPTPILAFPIVKHNMKVVMNLNKLKLLGIYRREGFVVLTPTP